MATSRYGEDYYRHERDYDAWERRFDARWAQLMRSRRGFAWGAFFFGLFVGAVIF
ncbi:MAG: hypothetical protein AAF742_00615 [Pseudomonadota bacterium]